MNRTFPRLRYIVEAAAAACADPRMHKYSPTAGLPELRATIAAKTARDSGYEVTASQVLVTNGGKQGVYNTFATLLDPGDEVLVPTPYWVTYPEAIVLAGGVAVTVATDEESGFRITVEQLEATCTDRTKVLLLYLLRTRPALSMHPERWRRLVAGPRPVAYGW